MATCGRWRELWVHYLLILSMVVAVAAFYVLARYRAPIVPLLIPFAAVGCMRMYHLLLSCAVVLYGRGSAGDEPRRYTDCAADKPRRYRSWLDTRRLAWSGALGVLAAVIANWPVHDVRRLDGLSWMNVGVALARAGELGSATPFFRKAVEEFPESAEANNNLAQVLAVQGEYAEAIPHYHAALRTDPTLMGVHYNLGVALERVGRMDEAVRHYRRAVEQDPNDAEAREAVRRLER
jgi:tetratricopeptide (TPR) repeat protein